jgi:hypothetical protein
MATRRRSALAAALLAAACAAAACSTVQAPVRPPVGWLFTQFSAPIDTNFSATPVGSKVGSADTHYIYIPIQNLPLELAFGDAAVERAARDAGITTIHYVDYEYVRILGIYQLVTVKVSGD